jgi:hypothetical protein
MSGWGASSHWYRVVEVTGDVRDQKPAAIGGGKRVCRLRTAKPLDSSDYSAEPRAGLESDGTEQSRLAVVHNSLWVQIPQSPSVKAMPTAPPDRRSVTFG